MYLAGRFGNGDEFVLNRLCGELPAHVHTIRLDMHALKTIGSEEIRTVRSVLRHWRHEKSRSFRLSLSSDFIVATYAEGRFVPGTR